MRRVRAYGLLMDAGVSQTIVIPGAEIGGPLAADPALCSARIIALLGEIAGEGMRMASLAMDITTNPLGERNVEVMLKLDKRARSIVFASAEARAGDDLVFTAQGLFSRAEIL